MDVLLNTEDYSHDWEMDFPARPMVGDVIEYTDGKKDGYFERFRITEVKWYTELKDEDKPTCFALVVKEDL